MYVVKWKFVLCVDYATAYGYLLNASTHHPITLIHRLKRCHMTSTIIVNDTTESTGQYLPSI